MKKIPFIENMSSARDRDTAYTLIDDWERGGPYAHNIVQMGLQRLAQDNKQLADRIYKHLVEEMNY